MGLSLEHPAQCKMRTETLYRHIVKARSGQCGNSLSLAKFARTTGSTGQLIFFSSILPKSADRGIVGMGSPKKGSTEAVGNAGDIHGLGREALEA